MAKLFEFDLKNDVKLPTVLADALGEEILSAGKFTTTMIKIVDYLKALGHRINNVLDYADDGEDNDSKPELTEIAKKAFTKGKKIKEEVEEAVEKVEETVEQVEDIVEEAKEIVENIVQTEKELLELVKSQLEEFYHTHLEPLERVLDSKTDSATVKKEYIDPLNKKLNKLSADLKAKDTHINELSAKLEKLLIIPEKEAQETIPKPEPAEPTEIVENIVEAIVEEAVDVQPLEEQAKDIDLSEVDQAKLEQVKDLSEKGL